MRDRGLVRKLGVLALVAAMGATAHGDRRAASTADLVSTFVGAVRIGSAIRHAASGWAAAAKNAASFGILYATVMSRFSPEVRQSILAAVAGAPEIRTGARTRSPHPVDKCTARRGASPAVRCSRA